MCHTKYRLHDNPEDTCCSTQGPHSGKSSCEGIEWAGNLETLELIEWVITDLEGKGVKPHPCCWTPMQNPSLFSTGRCRDVRVSLFPAHPPALVRALLVQSRKRPQEEPSRNAVTADGTAGSASLPSLSLWLIFARMFCSLKADDWRLAWVKATKVSDIFQDWWIGAVLWCRECSASLGHFQRKEMLHSVFVTQCNDL